MQDLTEVKTASFAVRRETGIIRTGSVGSCVVVAVYDEKNRVGALAHAMLPKKGKETETELGSPAKYADEAVRLIVAEAVKAGAGKDEMKAKIIGGAIMFPKLTTRHNIGVLNVESAREELASLGIPIEGEDTGGNTGRLVEFNVANGLMEIMKKL